MTQPQQHQPGNDVARHIVSHYKRMLYLQLMGMPVEKITDNDADLMEILSLDRAIQQLFGGG